MGQRTEDTSGEDSSAPNNKPSSGPPVVLFDDNHGQPNWTQTGFSSREIHTNFAGLADLLRRLGCQCRTTNQQPLSKSLHQIRLLVIPTPTGRYDTRRERWVAQKRFLFSPAEITDIFQFLESGGRLLAFAYRFGDSFTGSNLRALFQPLGCDLNDDAVIDAAILRTTHPLRLQFQILPDSLPLHWSRRNVSAVEWRPAATFTILPELPVWPLALSAGGRCLGFNRTLRQIRFGSLPLAVAGRKGAGRFALFGGPHLVESGLFGLLNNPGNSQFIQNVVQWLLSDEPDRPGPPHSPHVLATDDQEFMCVESRGQGENAISSIERVLRKTGVLKALARARWNP